MMYKSTSIRNFLWATVFSALIFAGIGCSGSWWHETSIADSVKKLIKQATNKTKPHEQAYKRGIDALLNEDYDDAIAEFRKAIELYPYYADAYYDIGMAYYSKKDYDNAIYNFNRTIELNPNDWRAYKSRGGVYYDDYFACVRKSRSGCDYDYSDCVKARNECDREKDIGRIVADFNRSMELNPDYADKLPKTHIPRKTDGTDGGTNGEKLRLVIIITDSVITPGALGGFMPSLSYKEFHRYITREQDLDTIIAYADWPLPKHHLTVHERYAILLYADDDNGNILKSMHTKSGELLTTDDGNPVESVDAGDTVYTVTNPRRVIAAANPADDFESRPLSVYDELKIRLIKIKERYREAPDADDITVGVKDGIHYDKVIPIMCAARIAGYRNISLASLEKEPLIIKSPQRVVKRGTRANSESRDSITITHIPPKSGSLTGGRSRASIQRVVMQNVAPLRYAYNRRLREKPGLYGTVTVKFAIDESGKVIFAQVVKSTINDPEIENTVVTRVQSWVFEQIDKPGDVTEVVYPFSFSQ